MQTKNLVHTGPNPNDSIYTQTSFSGKLRWFYKPLYDEPTLQQEQVVRHIENYVTTRIETNWVDVPIAK